MINVPVHALTTRCPLILINNVPEWGMRVPFPSQERPGDTFYTTQPQDTVFSLAQSFYGDVKLWWIIWDNNPESFSGDPMYVPTNAILRIPTKQAVEMEILNGH